MVKKQLVLAFLLSLGACTKPSQVPTEAQFEANPQLLADWIKKCTSGDYSNLGSEDHAKTCGSAQSAAAVLTAKEAAKKHEQLFAK